MNPIKKLKAWRDRRFQKRVLNALGAEFLTAHGNESIIFDRSIVSKHDIQSLDNVPVIDTDEIHGVPV